MRLAIGFRFPIGICLIGFFLMNGVTSAQTAQPARYVGSLVCQTCHSEIYKRWSKTRMANVVVDPKAHPEAILPDLSKKDPLVTFTKDDIAFTYGSKWKQRYFKKVGDDYFPLPRAMGRDTSSVASLSGSQWNRLVDGVLSGGQHTRPTGPLCDGCHSVNYNIETKAVTEWNVGCEKCHGPGSEHVRRPSPLNMVNPARLDYVRANDICIQCHSQGRTMEAQIRGKYYDWPVGFQAGLDLKDFWKLEKRNWARLRSRISRTGRRTRIGCRVTISCRV